MILVKEKTRADNRIEIRFPARSENESFARIAIAAFVARFNPTMEELSDIKTAVSEAVTNAIIHGYQNEENGYVVMQCISVGNEIEVSVIDTGVGIEDIEKAMEPLFTTQADSERSGMGFSFMEAFMDELRVESTVGVGTTVHMKKKIGSRC